MLAALETGQAGLTRGPREGGASTQGHFLFGGGPLLRTQGSRPLSLHHNWFRIPCCEHPHLEFQSHETRSLLTVSLGQKAVLTHTTLQVGTVIDGF